MINQQLLLEVSLAGLGGWGLSGLMVGRQLIISIIVRFLLIHQHHRQMASGAILAQACNFGPLCCFPPSADPAHRLPLPHQINT